MHSFPECRARSLTVELPRTLELDKDVVVAQVALSPFSVESPTTAHRRGRLDAVIAGLLFMGGLRRSEVSALEWRDVSDARDGDGVLLTVRTSKTNQEGDAADVRYLKNGAAKAIRTLRAADAAPPPRIGWSGCRRYRFSAASPPPPAPPASRRA